MVRDSRNLIDPFMRVTNSVLSTESPPMVSHPMGPDCILSQRSRSTNDPHPFSLCDATIPSMGSRWSPQGHLRDTALLWVRLLTVFAASPFNEGLRAGSIALPCSHAFCLSLPFYYYYRPLLSGGSPVQGVSPLVFVELQETRVLRLFTHPISSN